MGSKCNRTYWYFTSNKDEAERAKTLPGFKEEGSSKNPDTGQFEYAIGFSKPSQRPDWRGRATVAKKKNTRPYILTASWFHWSSSCLDQIRLVSEVDGGNLKFHIVKGGDWRNHPEGEINTWLHEHGLTDIRHSEGPENYASMSVCHIRNRDLGLAFRMRFT